MEDYRKMYAALAVACSQAIDLMEEQDIPGAAALL